MVLVNGEKSEPSYRVREGDILMVKGFSVSPRTARAEAKSCLSGTEICKNPEKDLLYKNTHLAVFNKPPGISIHGEGSFLNSVMPYLLANSESSISFSPGPLHRLDKGTSGLLFFSLSLAGARVYTEELRNKRIKKYYLGLVQGKIQSCMNWSNLLERDISGRTVISSKGKASETSLKPLLSGGKASLVLFRISTGRRHQIRAQASYHGHPLIGDLKYGSDIRNLNGYSLHAVKYVFNNLIPEIGFRSIFAPPPAFFNNRIFNYFPRNEVEEIIKKIEYTGDIVTQATL